jgi:hypothetical protein
MAKTASVAAIAKTNISVQLAAEDPSRTGLVIQNNVGAVFYVRFGGVASLALFSVVIPANTVYEVPERFVFFLTHGVWATGGGQADAAMVSQAFNV